MKIERAELNQFRSYECCALTPCEGVNVLLGDNGQGKTNVLEALYLCCTGRSHRTRQDRELIRWGAECASVRVLAQRRDGDHDVEIALSALGRRRVKVFGQEISRSGELLGHVTGVLFSPEDLRTVKDGPAERRRFVDMALSQIKPAYYYALQRYARALKQRNETLKAIAAQPALAATLDAWDEQLAAARETDLKRQTTSLGAHRDDIRLLVGGRDVRAFGSQGQQRTAALAMRLSELAVMTEEMGEPPVLMLDDVMSELDPSRRRQLLSHLRGIQTLVTCTDLEDLAGAEVGAAWRVAGAELERM